jgi:hypothetical protein
MATNYNPSIVTSGLVLYLDVGNVKSYPGTGTVLTDLSGNGGGGTLINGPTYNSANGGSLVFNGSNTYVSCTSSVTAIKGLNAFSFFIWLKSTSSSPSRRYAFDGRGNKVIAQKAAGIGFGFDSGYSDNKTFNFMSGNDGTYTESNSPTTFLNNSIYQLGIIRQANSSTFNGLDIDSKTIITPSFTAPRMTAAATVDFGEYSLGTYASSSAGGNYWWAGNIYMVIGYNRALSQDEVLQNYNALRGRFGL